jgi:predicted lipoprotein with Yx(FWY)xxD motif
LQLEVSTTVTLTVHPVAGLGSVVTDGQGRTLYMFPPDAGSRVSCTGPCAGTWPPVVIASNHRPSGGAGIDVGEIGTVPDPNSGAKIVTYAGFPLYRYEGDAAAGTANGQGLFLDGGPWYALTPAGQPITAVDKSAS